MFTLARCPMWMLFSLEAEAAKSNETFAEYIYPLTFDHEEFKTREEVQEAMIKASMGTTCAYWIFDEDKKIVNSVC